MTNKDRITEGQPSEEADPLSATGMFLSAFGKEMDAPQTRPEEGLAQPANRLETKPPVRRTEQTTAPPAALSPENSAVGGAPKGPPGEFTQMFQAVQNPPKTTPQAPPVQPMASSVEARQSTPAAPGEFTRIFVRSVEANPADRTFTPAPRAVPEAPPAPNPAAGPSRMKGFSSGASDSASAEGGFAQVIQARPTAPAPAPRSQPSTPPFPTPPMPSEEVNSVTWDRLPRQDHDDVEMPSHVLDS